jgi:hypothetical protein
MFLRSLAMGRLSAAEFNAVHDDFGTAVTADAGTAPAERRQERRQEVAGR